ncbi:MAG: TrmH family RNA methyltransferase, partial [Coriobacteriales bacterium]
ISVFVEEHWFEHELPVIERLESENPNILVYIADNGQFHELTGYEVTRGALAAFKRPPLPPVEKVLSGARRVAVLEDVTNYANIGAIFRSAAALGIDAVLVSPSCHDPYYRRAARVSMGSVFQVPWTRIGSEREWAPEGIPMLHDLGFATVAMALHDGSISLDDQLLKGYEKLAIVLGSEGDGLFQSTIDACDHCVTIPMSHDVDSLNVAAASAVAFWELRA